MSTSSLSSLTLDLTSDILLRLPADSVVRCRYVSKLWSSITNNPYFTDTFETRSLARPSLLMFFRKKGKLFVFSFPQHNKNSNELRDSYSQQHVDSYHMKYPRDCHFSFSISESVHGLICFRKAANPVIWNPSMRQFLTLKKPRKDWKYAVVVFLGYDPIEGKHKVVCLPRAEASDVCQVLTLGSAQESWITVKTNHTHVTFITSLGRCINGVLYYRAYIDVDDSVVAIIMNFDVRTEKFGMIRSPSEDLLGMLIPYEGRLACLDSDNFMDKDGFTLWILEDPEQNQWSCKHFPTPFVRSLENVYKINGVSLMLVSLFVYHPSLLNRFLFYILILRETA